MTIDSGELCAAALAWLGSEREVRQTGQSVKLIYRFAPVSAIGGESRKLKIELNIVEHQALLGLAQYSFSINNPWFKGESRLVSFSAEELLATKFRALLQRHKDRDLFDLGFALRSLNLNDSALVRCFCGYVAGDGKGALRRANIERILLNKLNRSLVTDIQPLLPSHVTYGQNDALEAFKALWLRLVCAGTRRSLEKHSFSDRDFSCTARSSRFRRTAVGINSSMGRRWNVLIRTPSLHPRYSEPTVGLWR